MGWDFLIMCTLQADKKVSDLMVHRILKGMKIENHDIIAFLKDCNEGEIRSQQAERDYHKLKSLRWLDS